MRINHKCQQKNLQIGDTVGLVDLVEPVVNLSPIDCRTVSQILSLVLFAKNIETEHPITVISK